MWKNYFCEHCGEQASFEVDPNDLSSEISRILRELPSCDKLIKVIASHKWVAPVPPMEMTFNGKIHSGNYVLDEEFVLEDLQLSFVGFSDYMKCKDCRLSMIIYPLTSGKHSHGELLAKRIAIVNHDYSTCGRRMMKKVLR